MIVVRKVTQSMYVISVENTVCSLDIEKSSLFHYRLNKSIDRIESPYLWEKIPYIRNC